MQRINSDLGDVRVLIHHANKSNNPSIKLGTRYDQFIITPQEALQLANDIADILDKYQEMYPDAPIA